MNAAAGNQVVDRAGEEEGEDCAVDDWAAKIMKGRSFDGWRYKATVERGEHESFVGLRFFPKKNSRGGQSGKGVPIAEVDRCRNFDIGPDDLVALLCAPENGCRAE